MAKKAYVWDGSSWITIASGALDLNEYLKLSTASSIYLSKSDASTTYLPISASSNYLFIETASAIYLSIEDAEDIYIPITASASIVSGLLSESNAANIYAPLISASLTGTPFAPTAASGTNTQQIATTEFVRTEISGLVNSAPSTLDTLNELALALGSDANFASSTASVLANKLDVSTASSLYRTLDSIVGLDKGGTGSNLTAIGGGIVYSGSAFLAITASGTVGQVLTSNGSDPPTWSNVSGESFHPFMIAGM